MKPLRLVSILAASVVALSLARPHVWPFIESQRARVAAVLSVADNPPSGASEEHFSPAENLERLDAAHLRTATKSIDIAVYAFTDRLIAEVLRERALHGVHIRIYRDQEQYRTEERNAARFRDLSTTRLLRGVRNIEIRVKQGSPRNLMHLKCYLLAGPSAVLLRDGSANWSPGGLKQQDNNMRYTTNPEDIRKFQQTFEAMWNRPTNLVIQ